VKVRKEYTLQINDKQFLLGSRTWLMGVINVTPDSFSDGGIYFKREKAVERGLELASEGADIIDIGGESTRPGAIPIPKEEEINRVIPVISELRRRTEVLISVDTTKGEVAKAAIEVGADIVNDISALRFDPEMKSLVAQKNIPVVLMHMKGTPQTMQINPRYDDVLKEAKTFLEERIEEALSFGIKKEKIIIDPGIGFGKRLEDNLALINNLSVFEDLERPILVGISRKSFLGKILNLPPEERLEGTIASAILSINHGAHILRVHDVEGVKRAVSVAEAIMNTHPRDSYFEEREKSKDRYVC